MDMSTAGFLGEYHLNMLTIKDSADELLEALRHQNITYQPKWVG